MATASLTIRDIPKTVLDRLRARAARHHRSMQGEILAILEAAALESRPRRTALEVWRQGVALGLKTPSEAAAMIRADRDEQ
jgi:plasmid stability protein